MVTIGTSAQSAAGMATGFVLNTMIPTKTHFLLTPTIATMIDGIIRLLTTAAGILQQARADFWVPIKLHRPQTFHLSAPASHRNLQQDAPILPTHYPTNARALQAELQQAPSTMSGFPIPLTPDEKLSIIDTSASATITICLHNVAAPSKRVQNTELKGIAVGLTVTGIGTTIYPFKSDTRSNFDVVHLNVLLVPNLPTAGCTA